MMERVGRSASLAALSQTVVLGLIVLNASVGSFQGWADPCEARAAGLATFDNKPEVARPPYDRSYYENELREAQDQGDDLSAADVKALLAAVDAWAKYDKTMADYKAAQEEMRRELDAAEQGFATERARFNQQRQILVNGPRDEAAFRAARDLKDQTRGVFEQLKARLLKYQCWPEVATFIRDTLEPLIFRLQRQKTALAADDDVSDPVEDDLAAGPLDLPALDDAEGTPADPGADPGQPGTGEAGGWAGVWSWGVPGDTGERVTISVAGGSISASFQWWVSSLGTTGQWTNCKGTGNTVTCDWTSPSGGPEGSPIFGTLTATLSGEQITIRYEDREGSSWRTILNRSR